MRNKKQTAVEWLINEFSEILGPLETKPIQDLLMVDAIKQAKEMEKQQIINACDVGFDDGCGFIEDIKYKNAEQYYKETYQNTK
jgi:hypothetical protein